MSTSAIDDAGQRTLEGVRPRLFGIAYRMLGTVAEAADVVQSAWLRWQGADREAVREPAAFLATTVTRLALNELESARARREVYVNPGLPEPVATSGDPALGAGRGEALELAVVLLLERLSPAERAAYVLHAAFGYPFHQIAEMLQVSDANARQLASRPRTRLGQDHGRRADPAQRARLFEAFLLAARAGDLARLEAVLTEDVVSISDGGGVVSAARVPVEGRERVARFVLGVLESFSQGDEDEFTERNGQPAVLAIRDGAVRTAVTLDASPDGIDRARRGHLPRRPRHRPLERSLSTLLRGRTVVAVAHRLHSAEEATRIAVTRDGRIVELGSHAELLARGAEYAALWRARHTG